MCFLQRFGGICMIKDITIGQYIPGNSFIHKLDPRFKIIISILFIIDLFLVNQFIGYLYVLIFIIVTILIANLSLKYIYNGLKPILILLLITAILNIFMTGGNGSPPLIQWHFIKIYKEGLVIAAFMIIRLVFLIMGTSILTLTTSPIELTDGIESLLKDRKSVV